MVRVGSASVFSGAGSGVAGKRVALGTIVMRGTGETRGVGVKKDRNVGLASAVGVIALVGVGSLREQALSASRISKGRR